jgi:parallel beta-helix repeat protein
MKTNYNGIYLSSSLNNAICENNLEDGAIGIFVGNDSNQNTVSDNTVTHYEDAGIWLQTSTNNVVFGNILIENEQGMTFRGSSNQNIIMNNTLAGNYRGVECHDSSENAIYRNNITDSSWFNFRMVRSSRNMIYSNNILNSYFGFWMTSSTNNSFYHNNIIRNLDSALTTTNDPNIWDNGYPSGGNFWGDYAGIDSSSDGIGEISYNVSQGNLDRYPLMGLFNSFNTSVGIAIDIISNSTVEGFEFFGFNNTIHFSALNRTAHQAYGFCRVTVPHDVLSPPYVVTVDSEITSYETIFENETLSIIYFTYAHSQSDVAIAPEFPSTLVLLIFMISILAAALVLRRRYIRNWPFL